MEKRLRTWLTGFCLLAAGASPVWSLDFRLESRTLLRSLERDTREENDAAAVPAYEYLRLETRSQRHPELSFHLYGWGRVDLAGSGYFDDDAEGELIYGYLQYARSDGRFDLKAGRFYVFEGVANESVDGLRVTRVAPAFSLSLYGGQPVSLAEEDGRQGDLIAGGRAAWRLKGRGETGVSYKYVGSDGERDEERAGLDLSLALPGDVTLLGTSVYNLVEAEWAEHFYEVRVDLGGFELRPSWQKYTYEGLLSDRDSSSPPFRVLSHLDNSAEILGAEGYWYPDEQTETGVRVRHFDYEMRLGDAWYLAALATWKWRILNQVGGELGRMDGDREKNRYTLARGFVYLDFLRTFITGDLMYVRYDRPVYHEDRSLFASLGGGRRFLGDRLRLKVSASYSSDPVFENDYRYTIIAEYLAP